ncbi:MAG: CHAD domain-containing protein [Nitrospira sp.]
MSGMRHCIHTAPEAPTQGLANMDTFNQDRVLLLLRQAIAGKEHADTIHAIRTHCRRLQALLELYGEAKRAGAVAACVGRLSKLRALQVFRQYLVRCHARRRDLAEVDDRLAKQTRKLNRMEAYHEIEQVVSKQALPAIASPPQSLNGRLDELRHEHECLLKQLIAAASDKPRRNRLHALRLALKTIRYQTEWLPGRAAAKDALLSQLKRVQAILGKYEELADFHRWGKKLSDPMQKRIKKDWKRARKRARHVPETMSWLLEAFASGQGWGAHGFHVVSVNRQSA